jgi:hypothetical protein
METEEIISKIQSGLKKVTEESGLDKHKISIKLSISSGFMKSLKTTLNQGDSELKKIDLGSTLGIAMLKMPMLNNYLLNTLSKMASSSSVKESDINARFITKTDDYYPSVYLYNKDILIREITVNELVS